MSAVATPVTGPRSVILIQLTPVARPVAPEVPSRTLVTMVSGISSTWPVRSAWRSGISAAGRATTGQPKLAQKPQLLQACWPLWPLTELAAIGNGNGCRPSFAAPVATATEARICGPGGIAYWVFLRACFWTRAGSAPMSPWTPMSCSTSS